MARPLKHIGVSQPCPPAFGWRTKGYLAAWDYPGRSRGGLEEDNLLCSQGSATPSKSQDSGARTLLPAQPKAVSVRAVTFGHGCAPGFRSLCSLPPCPGGADGVMDWKTKWKVDETRPDRLTTEKPLYARRTTRTFFLETQNSNFLHRALS